jgi:hypothetical protein
MRRLGALIGKELREHGLVLGALTLLLVGVALLLLLGSLAASRTMTLLETHATFVRFFLPIAALALGHRLIVLEYQRGTQRFLEALPLRRWEVLVTKLALALGVLSIAALGSLALSLAAAALREPITLRWVAIVLVKTELFALTLGVFFLTMGLAGRFRIPIYLTLLFALAFLGFATDVELARFGPFALVGERFVLERDRLPVGEVLETALLIAGMLGIGAFLALGREGSIADALARRMSAREKAIVGVVLIGAMVASELFDTKKDKDPFTFDHEAVVRLEDPRVEVLYLEPRHRPRAEALAALVASDLRGVRDALALEALPAVHVALRESIDPRAIERVELEENDGVLVRASFASDGFDRDALRARLIERVLEHVTGDRAAFEPYAWVRTGFAEAWVHSVGWRAPPRARPGSAAPLPSPARSGEALPSPALRALHVARTERPRFVTLARWQRTEERLGPAGAEGLAYAAAAAIVARAGQPKWLAFARSTIAREPPPAALAVIDLRLDPIAARLERETGMSPEALDAAMQEQIARWRASERARRLARVPRLRASLAMEGRAIVWRVSADRPFEPGATCSLLHAAAGPFDRPLRPEALFREERLCAALADPEALAGRHGPGERVLVAVELDTPTLGAPVRVAAARLEVP